MTTNELRERRSAATRAWESFVHEGRALGVRDEVAASWRRSAGRVDATADAAPVDDDDAAVGAWRSSAVATAFAGVETDLVRTAADCDYVAAVTDASGRIVWSSGGPTMRRRAERVNFVPGGRWDEASVGTNALDLALRGGDAATVYSAEHFSQAVHGWVCYAAPIRHPVTGDVLGVIDLSSTWDRANPMALTTVAALARSVAAEMARALSTRPGPNPGDASRSDARMVMRLLGSGEVEVDGVRCLLTRRQVEILALLAAEPSGLTLEQLHERLYGDSPVSTSTLKAEMSHLRRAVGGGIASRPYRLQRRPDCDAVRVMDLLRAGDTAGAVADYGGPLLPVSDSPALTAWRHEVDVAVRSAVLAERDADHAMTLSDRLPHDADLAHLAWVLLPSGDPRRAVIAGRLSSLEDV